jgi:nitrate reductase alpha subunit
MSHFLDRLKFLSRVKSTYSDGHGAVVNEDRKWENTYRSRWQHDKIVRSTHGVNCTGSCSWKVYVKNGLITWETQQTDYPRTRPDLPNHEPRGCPRGASYSWYVYSPAREVPDDARPPDGNVARGAQDHGSGSAWESISQNPRKPATRACAARAASCARTGRLPPRSSRRPMPTRSSSTARTA